MRELGRRWALIGTIIAVAMSTYQLSTGFMGAPEALQHRSIHLLFSLILAFVLYPVARSRDTRHVPVYDIVLIALSVTAIGYLFANYHYVMTRFFYVDSLRSEDFVLGGILILLVLEATRRVIGWMLPALAILFMLYALVGNYIPGPLNHYGVPLETLIDQMYLITEGIFGMALGVSATYVVLFVIFGAFLERSGVGDFFIQLANSIAGGSRGGPAKVAVVSSALIGTVSGSSTANVVTTGNFTIPMMKRIGYKPHFAGAVEAAASTGGQIMPPIMGAAAFVMAEFSGIPYLEIIKHAALPAFLYFAAVYVNVHFEAVRTGLVGLPKSELPSFIPTLTRGGHLALPLVIIVVILIMGYTPMYAAINATLSVVVLSWLRKETRMGPRLILQALANGAKAAIVVSLACASAGIIVGVVALTGLGLKFTGVVLLLAGQSLFLALVLTMIAALVLGMGLPTTPAYIMQAALLIPAIVKMGVLPVAAHMFAFYFAIISVITPPVALASYVAAGVAKADSWKTSITAFKLGAVAYIVPFMFVYSPALLLVGPWDVIVRAFVTACIGVFCLGAGLQGWLFTRATLLESGLMVAAALTLIYPEWTSDVLGIAIFGLAVASQQIRMRRAARKAEVTPATSDSGSE